MSGTSDIIAYGFGGWSTVSKIPTLGFGATPVSSNAFSCGLVSLRSAVDGTTSVQSEVSGLAGIMPATDGIIAVGDC